MYAPNLIATLTRSKNPDLENIAQLIKNGADVNEGTGFMDNALCSAAFFIRKDIVKFLLDNGADVNIMDESGETALHTIIYRVEKPVERSEIAKLLLEKGANPNGEFRRKSEDGVEIDPLLSYAARQGDLEIVKLLIEYGADINSKHHKKINALNGKTALDAVRWCQSRGNDRLKERYKEIEKILHAEMNRVNGVPDSFLTRITKPLTSKIPFFASSINNTNVAPSKPSQEEQIQNSAGDTKSSPLRNSLRFSILFNAIVGFLDTKEYFKNSTSILMKPIVMYGKGLSSAGLKQLTCKVLISTTTFATIFVIINSLANNNETCERNN